MKVVDRLLMIVVSFLFFFYRSVWSSPSFFVSSGWWRIVSTGRLALDDGNDTVIDWTALDC